MSMSKQDFIALANHIKDHNTYSKPPFSVEQLKTLANFCRNQNGRFMTDRWLDYVAGKCGPNGGAVRS